MFILPGAGAGLDPAIPPTWDYCTVHCQQNILGKFRLEPQTILNAQQPVTDKILIFNKIKNFHSAYLCTFRPRNNLNTQQAG